MSITKNTMGFTMLELLIVMTIVGILASITFVSGRQIMRTQEETAVLSQFKQIVSRGASTASARGISIVLNRTNSNFILRENTTAQKELQRFTLPSGVTINLSNGTILEFTPSGLIKSLAALPNPLTVVTSSKTYQLRVSIIGEIKVTP
jgi:prepilin-type N-terminal cleavage/methylation domain-containing protein